ncbi:olfactory receptor 1f45-like [Pelodiscus sinensis]|uniref:olfactory receptor 1f45-like n=1 Tax=Pelodiscus sinensis TaxID=13735 RepID=UPI003F6A800D
MCQRVTSLSTPFSSPSGAASAPSMDEGNWTSVSQFVLLGLSKEQDLLIVVVLLVTYLVNLAGNSLLLGLVVTDPQLCSPMYFLLSHLAVVDMSFASISLPQALVHALTQHRAVSFTSCMAQLFMFFAVGNMENYLLAAMAYDRYVAVCDPLRYAAVVTRSLCLKMVAASWAVVIAHALLHTVMAANLRYCGNRLQYFFCDLPPLLLLSCTRPLTIKLMTSPVGFLVWLSPFAFILASYVRIGVAVARLRSAQGLRKALSTCSSHLTVVLLKFSIVMCLYFRRDSSDTHGYDQKVTFLDKVLSPTLNPIIYSLRNRDVVAALRRAGRKVLTWGM